MAGDITIYGLVDPVTSQIRYVGKTSLPGKTRLLGHLAEARNGSSSRVASWLRTLAPLLPEFVVLEMTTRDSWREDEQFWMSYFRFAGADLTNTVNGGIGTDSKGPRGLSNAEKQRRYREKREARIKELEEDMDGAVARALSRIRETISVYRFAAMSPEEQQMFLKTIMADH